MRHRIDWKTVNNMVKDFLAREVSEIEVKREARYLITSPKKIAEHTKLSARTVRAHLLEMTGKSVDGKIMIIKINKTEVVAKLAGHSYSTDENRPRHSGATGEVGVRSTHGYGLAH